MHVYSSRCWTTDKKFQMLHMFSYQLTRLLSCLCIVVRHCYFHTQLAGFGTA